MGNPELVQLPWLGVTEIKSRPAGKVSVMVTSPALMGWRLTIVMV